MLFVSYVIFSLVARCPSPTNFNLALHRVSCVIDLAAYCISSVSFFGRVISECCKCLVAYTVSSVIYFVASCVSSLIFQSCSV